MLYTCMILLTECAWERFSKLSPIGRAVYYMIVINIRFVNWRVKQKRDSAESSSYHSMSLLEDLSILARLRTIDLTITVIVKTTYQNRFNTTVRYLFGREKFCWLLEQSCLMTVESFNWSQYVYCKQHCQFLKFSSRWWIVSCVTPNRNWVSHYYSLIVASA